MQPFRTHVGVAAALLQANVDTDAIIPSREMRHVSRRGLAAGLFANWRYVDAAGREPQPDFILNRPRYAGASILLCGANFGCGSSREHAVWALAEFGIRVLVAPSFGLIFRKNCIANGVLAAELSAPRIAALAAWADADPQVNRVRVDLQRRAITGGGVAASFAIDDAARMRLIEGLDAIAFTLAHAERIDAFERERFARHPWVRLPRSG